MSQNEQQGLMGISSRKGKEFAVGHLSSYSWLLQRERDCSLKRIKNMCCGRKSMGFPDGTSGKEPTCQCRRHRDMGSIPGLGRSPEEGHGSPLQFSYLENPMNREAWRLLSMGSKSRTHLKRLSTAQHVTNISCGVRST